MKFFKYFLYAVVVQVAISFGSSAYGVYKVVSGTTCTGSASFCSSLTGDTSALAIKLLLVAGGFGVLTIVLAYLAYRRRSAVLAGLIAAGELLILVQAVFALGNASASKYSVILTILLSGAAFVLGILAISKGRGIPVSP